MKILYVITRAVHGGAQKHLLDLVANLPGNVEAVVACGESGYLAEALRGTRARFVRLNWLVRPVSPLADLRGIRELRALIRAERPDLVHAHSSKAGILARVAGASLGVPTVFTAHGFAFQTGLDGRLRTVAVASERACGPLSAHIITVSDADHRLANRVRLARPDRVSTVWNGVPDTARRADPGRSPVRVTMVARFDDPKDQATLLLAAAKVSGDLELVFVGDGPTRPAVEAQARSLGLSRVSFLGTRDDVEAVLADAQVFALTSLKEGLPLTSLEAMRAGLPVV
ncbi:MAG TPA: glycosyltransferase, partial [Deinococcales bacterium]|nr:glycosyltransferase [Deinococcales bacterium]